jgi:hypothetical protein
VSFPDLALNANCGPGTSLGDAGAMISNNIISSSSAADGAFFSCGQVTESTPIGGYFVRHIDIEFDDVVPAGIEPDMLSSDALPLFQLSTEFSYLMIHTDLGLTQIKFAPPTLSITQNYDAVVDFATGPHAALFPAGERIQFTYTLSPNATDRDTANPLHANYRNAVLDFNVTFPDLGIFGNGGPPQDWADGETHVSNDAPLPSGALTDQVHFVTSPTGSTTPLGGEAISLIRLNFEDFPLAPASSPMLSSDGLPLGKLTAGHQYLSFHTSSGITFVRFILAPSDQVEILIGDVNGLVSAGTITADVADRPLRSLESAASSIAKNNTGSACSHIRTFIRRVQDEMDAGGMPAVIGNGLIERAEELQDLLGC